MKLIKKPMTLEQYEAKYPHYQTKLISFSDNEIKEFNNKFHKSNGKDIPNKYALLEKYKWVHIKDRYYQIPQTGKKIGIAGGCAVVVAAAIALPIILLNNVTLNEQEFKDTLIWFATPSEDRKFSVPNGKLAVDLSNIVTPSNEGKDTPEKIDAKLELEVEGYSEKASASMSGESKAEEICFTGDGTNTFIYQEEADGSHWRRQKPNSATVSSLVTVGFDKFITSFESFKKHGLNTYSTSNIEYTLDLSSFPIGSAPFKTIDVKADVAISFNKDKSIKNVNQTLKADLSQFKTPGLEGEFKINLGYSFKDVATHSISEFPELVKEDIDVYTLDTGSGIFYGTQNATYIPKETPTTFKVTLTDAGGSCGVDSLAICTNSSGEEPEYYDFTDSVCTAKVDGEDADVHLSNDKYAWVLNNKVTTSGVEVAFTITLNKDLDTIANVDIYLEETIDNFCDVAEAAVAEPAQFSIA